MYCRRKTLASSVAYRAGERFVCPSRSVVFEPSSAEENSMEPVVLALASNERYLPGLYCAVASALSHLDPTREVDLRVLDGGLSQVSRETLSRLVGRGGGAFCLAFVASVSSVCCKAAW